jgi:hypothetical protein
MADTTNLIKPGSLDKLAKLLAVENIMIEHKPIKTAYFDVKNRVLALPMWKDMPEYLYHFLALHEVGHALYTDATEWKGAIDKIEEEKESKRIAHTFQGYLNVIEDARIERKMKTKFPGSRRDFIDGYKWLHENDFFEIKNDDLDTLSLIDRINLYFKIGTIVRVKFSEEERVFVQRAEQTITFNDVENLARDVLEYVKAKREQDNEQEDESFAQLEEGEGGEEGFEDVDGDGDDEGDSERAANEDDAGNDGSIDSATKKEEKETVDEAKTDRAMNDRMEELLDPRLSSREFKYIYFPKDLTYEPFTYSYREVLELVDSDLARAKNPYLFRSYCGWLTSKFRRENSSAINYMVKEFEMKKAAIAYSRSKQAKTGVIDVNKLHSYRFNDDIFKRLTIEPTGKNHGVVAILDMSGSMSQNYRGAMDQLISLAMFCRRVGIPHRFYGFTSVISGNDQVWTKTKLARSGARGEMKRRIQQRLNKEFVFPDKEFDLLELFNEKMNLKEFNEMIGILLAVASKYDYHSNEFAIKNGFTLNGQNSMMDSIFGFIGLRFFGLGGTPLNDSLLVCRDLINKFRKEKNVQIMNFICITDGESNHSTVVDEKGNDRLLGVNATWSNITRIFIDEESKMQTAMTAFDGYADVTAMFARIVRDATESNFVGFYITTSTYEVRSAISKYTPTEHYDKTIAKYKKEKSLIIPKMLNFHEFYLIQGGANLRAQQAKFDEAKDLKKGQLAKAFINAQNKRGGSRMILSRFIEKIAA